MYDADRDKVESELESLVALGEKLYYSIALENDRVDEATKATLEDMELPDFRNTYERWYTSARQAMSQILPQRLDDFTILYRNDKRKETNFTNYSLSDYMIGVRITRGVSVVVGPYAAIPKFKQQLDMLRSAQAALDSALTSITSLVRADLFDSELDQARELARNGFLRAAGAVAGVVLEGHLSAVCAQHSLKSRKKKPTINDLNELLKGSDVIDVATWRLIQHLGDLRNLCDHKSDRDPSADDVQDLISGADKITKTLF